MQFNLGAVLNQLPNQLIARALTTISQFFMDRLSCSLLSTGGLAIKTGGSAVVKAGTLCKYVARGVLGSIAANTDMPALVGTVTNAKFNVFVFSIDYAGTVSVQMGIEGATIGAVQWPKIPQRSAVIGFVIINPTGTGNFVGGTTALDDATVVPGAIYVNTPFPFEPGATY